VSEHIALIHKKLHHLSRMREYLHDFFAHMIQAAQLLTLQ
jgi:hypothetical protein